MTEVLSYLITTTKATIVVFNIHMESSNFYLTHGLHKLNHKGHLLSMICKLQTSKIKMLRVGSGHEKVLQSYNI